VRSSAKAASTSWALSGWIFFLRPLVATTASPAGRGWKVAPRNADSVEDVSEIEKRRGQEIRGDHLSPWAWTERIASARPRILIPIRIHILAGKGHGGAPITDGAAELVEHRRAADLKIL